MADTRESEIRAEKAVIGCLLEDPNCLDGINLVPEMFAGQYSRRIFEEFAKARGERLDPVILRGRIPDADIPDEFLYGVLNECAGIPMSSIEVDKYAALVFEAYRTRKLKRVADPDKTNSEIIQDIEALTFTRPAVSIAKITRECSAKCFSPKQDPGFKTGFPVYDGLMGGLKRGNLSVVGARTSVGKSAFGIETALNLAKQGVKVRYFSTEMSREEVYERLVAHESGISAARIQNADHFMSEQEAEFFDAGNAALEKLDNLVIDDDIFELDDVITAMVGYDVAIIDYIQEIRTKGSRRDRYEEIAQICLDLRIAAKRHGCHVILLSQLNRYVKDTDEPDVDHLSESDALGKSAAQVTLIWNHDASRVLKGVKVAKNRHGRTGKMMMKFDGAVCRFTPVANEWKKAEEDGETPFT